MSFHSSFTLATRRVAVLAVLSVAVAAPALAVDRRTEGASAQPRLDRIVALGMISKKPTQLAAWYTTKFGLRISEVASCGGIFGVLQTCGGPVHLAIFDDERCADATSCGSHVLAHRVVAAGARSGCDSRSLYFEVTNFEGYFARLKAAGLEPSAQFDAGSGEQAAVYIDPDGRAIGIWGTVAR